MGYGVYEDSAARDQGVERWAGYAVPAYCDWAECSEEINRGLAYKCDEDDDSENAPDDPCGLFFCYSHLSLDHSKVIPKQDNRKWLMWIATDESWDLWRKENPAAWARIQDRIGRA